VRVSQGREELPNTKPGVGKEGRCRPRDDPIMEADEAPEAMQNLPKPSQSFRTRPRLLLICIVPFEL
jgi:hypothetical protein